MQLYTATLRYFVSKILGPIGGSSNAPRCQKLSPQPVKVLGHTDLSFFIPAGLTALHENNIIQVRRTLTDGHWDITDQ